MDLVKKTKNSKPTTINSINGVGLCTLCKCVGNIVKTYKLQRYILIITQNKCRTMLKKMSGRPAKIINQRYWNP